MNKINIFKGVESNYEKKIYISIYFIIIFATATVWFSGFAGWRSSSYIMDMFNLRFHLQQIQNTDKNAGDMSSMLVRIKSIQKSFNEVKYGGRAEIRTSVNNDLQNIGFEVHASTLKDVPAEQINAKIALAKSVIGSKSEVKATPDMVEVDVTGRIALESLMKFFVLCDRTDRFWYLDQCEILPPEGFEEFYSRNFQMLPTDKKKELYAVYSDVLKDPYVTINCSIYTFVNEEKTPATDKSKAFQAADAGVDASVKTGGGAE